MTECIACFQSKCTCSPRVENEVKAKTPKFKTGEKGRVLCHFCNEPIHIERFAGIDKHGLFHNLCMLVDSFSFSDKYSKPI